MGAGKGQVVVFVSGDTQNLQQSLQQGETAIAKFEKRTDSMGDNLTGAGKKMTLFATVPIVAGLGLATNAASNLEQSMGAVESIFGTNRGTIDAWANTAATAAGLSKREVNEMAAVLGASLQGVGFEAGESANKVVELQKRGADMAATFGGTTKEALDAVASLMRGERDPIEKYGVSIKAVDVSARIAAMGLDTTTTAAKKNAEAVAGLDLLMEATAKTQGQFARESDSAAGAQQRAKAAIENSAASLGEQLLPLAAGAADKVAFLAEKFGDLPAPAQKAVLVLGGMAAMAGPILTVAGNVAKLGDKLHLTGTQASGAARGVAGFAAKAGIAVGVTLAAVEALNQWAKATADNVPEQEALTASVLDFTESAQLANQLLAITGAGFENLGEKIRKAGNSPFSIFDKSGIREVQEANQQIDALDKTLASLFSKDPEQARAMFATLTEEAGKQGVSVATVKDRFNDYTEAVKGAENAVRLGTAPTAELTDKTEGLGESAEDAAKAVGGLGDATLDAESSTDDMVDAQKDAAKAYDDAAEKVQDYHDKLVDAKKALDAAMTPPSADDLEGAALRIERALIGQGDAMDAITAAESELDRIRRSAGTPEEIAAAEGELREARKAQAKAAHELADAEDRVREARAALAAAGAPDAEKIADAKDRVAQAKLRERDAREKVADETRDLTDAQKDLATARAAAKPEEIADGERKVELALRAQRDAGEDLTRATQDLTEAKEALAEAKQPDAAKIAAAERDLSAAFEAQAAAGRDLTAANREMADAQEALTATRKPASVEEIKEAERRLADAIRDQREAVLALREAQERQQELQRQGTDEDQRVIEARRDVESATRDLADAVRDQDRAAKDAERANGLLLDRLNLLAQKFPDLRDQVYEYIYALGAIPKEVRTSVVLDPKPGEHLANRPGGAKSATVGGGATTVQVFIDGKEIRSAVSKVIDGQINAAPVRRRRRS